MGELAKKETEASRKKHELVRMRQTVRSQFIKQHWSSFGRHQLTFVLFVQEMDIESLEAANQSLQADLKLAFKRIGDLQAAIEDEMESDDNEDLINR